MAATDPFSLEVYFSGLVFYVTGKPDSDGKIEKVTHVVLRDGREGQHDYGHGYLAHGGHSELLADDFAHTALVEWVDSNGKPQHEKLEKEWVYFEWRDTSGSPIHDTRATKPSGAPADVKDRLPTKGTASSFYWVPCMHVLGPKNAVVEHCYKESAEKPAVVALVPLKGGKLRTSVFAWAQELEPKPKTKDRVVKVRWIPRLPFCPEAGMPTAVDRAAAEGVTWTVEPPGSGKAATLHVCKRKFDSKKGSPCDEVVSFTVKKGEKALVGVTNYPPMRRMPDNEIHPGRKHDYGSMHFEMFYDLLMAPVPPGIRHIPWIPGALRDEPPWRRNAIRYSDLERRWIDLHWGRMDKVAKHGKPPKYETAAEAFAKDDRPLCVGSGGSGG